MLWRVRATLADRPGALATLAQRCGEREVNILALQIFPGVEGVTDELVLSAPDGWAPADVADLVESAGGTRVGVGACTEQSLMDAPTRYLTAVRQVLHGADRVPTALARLLDALPVAADAPVARPAADQDTMLVGSGAERVEVRRATPFTPTEHARATAFVEAVTEMRAAGRLVEPEEAVLGAPRVADGPVVVRPATFADTAGLMEMHVRCSAETVFRLFEAPMVRLDRRLARRMLLEGAGAMVATVGDRMVGMAALGDVVDDRCEVSLLVEDGWQRRGIGTRLLGAATGLAAGQGAEDVVLRGPAESPAAVALAFGSGLRARAKLSGDVMVVTVSTRGLAPLGAAGPAGLPAPVPTPA